MTSHTHQDFTLYTTNEKFYLEPIHQAQGAKREVLEIDRLNFEFNLLDYVPSNYGAKKQIICTLLGITHLLSGPYLVVVLKKKEVGMLGDHMIWKVEKADIIPFSRSNAHLTTSQVTDNEEYEAMIRSVLATPSFYYSHTYDISLSLQFAKQLSKTRSNFSHLPLHERGDTRFIWNGPIIRDLSAQPELRRFIVPCIHGFCTIMNCTLNSKKFTFALISRRSIYRAGTRFCMRGIDSEGHVANYVETEQVVIYDNTKASFVQVRGSIPLFWCQVPEMQYKPMPTLLPGGNHLAAIQKHYDEQVATYGKVVCVSLVDNKGKEKVIGEKFGLLLNQAALKLVRYEYFDFHKECRKMQWHKLSILISRLSAEQLEFKYYYTDSTDDDPIVYQTGVFRTNCIDCLDRTNVVQSMLAELALQQQLQKMAVLSTQETVKEHASFYSAFKNVWADNADHLSIQYAGTKALKTDFTRTGKRTQLGAMRDLTNSATRYVYNNFFDGVRQDSIDLFLGNYVVDRYEGVNMPSPLRVTQPLQYRLLLILLLSLIAAFFMALLMPMMELMERSILLQLILFALLVAVGTAIYSNGSQYVNYPRLNLREHDKQKVL